MNRASRNLLVGSGTLLAGLWLWRFARGVDLPLVTPTKVGVVMMCVGGAEILLGLYRAARASAGPR
ncbi:DUF5708 family protein [Streptomyces viridosporus]|uniref:DUF5708 family protein n=1 Tax=Streptomyces viridosporus TaxID=67581 RepID=UPI0009BD3389|nr:DUF5708 family protein [Streptomyces viridosporus]